MDLQLCGPPRGGANSGEVIPFQLFGRACLPGPRLREFWDEDDIVNVGEQRAQLPPDRPAEILPQPFPEVQGVDLGAVSRNRIDYKHVLAAPVNIDRRGLCVVHRLVPDDAPDLLRARLYAIDIDHVVDATVVAVVPATDPLDLVSMAAEEFPLRTPWEVFEVLPVMVVV